MTKGFFSLSEGHTPQKMDFRTSTTIWPVDELISSEHKAWKQVTEEDSKQGNRAGARQAHDKGSPYTGTYSVFPMPLAEWMLLRYAGDKGGKVLDSFAGGPPRALAAYLLGYEYHGIELRNEAIQDNLKFFKKHGLTKNIKYHLGKAQDICDFFRDELFDFAYTCPPYWNLEVYSEHEDDLSNVKSYDDFMCGIDDAIKAQYSVLKAGAFSCWVVNNFRDKKTSDIYDFRGDLINAAKRAGFTFWQDVILSKRLGTAAVRAGMYWKNGNYKLVPRHEYLLVFRK